MKTAVLFALLLVATTAALVLGGEPAKPVDTYADHQKYCFKKCTHFKSIKGKCVDFEWVGTKKECCQWKKVGQGKCLEYKKEGRCVKHSKARKICIGHGYRQVCSKVTRDKICSKWEWKELCKKHGHNNACKDYAFHFICTKYDQAHRCAEEIYIPKIKYFFKQRCARYRVDRYCSKYKTITKTVPKWIPVTGKHYKGWIDHYWHQILTKKSHRICVEISKRKKCVKFEKVKFSKKIGYEKKCVKFITNKFCVQKKKIKFCTKFTPSKFCAFREKVRICKKFREQQFCCAYKAKPFCTQFKFLKPRCVKKKFKKICVRKSKGVNICKKFNFVGGKKVCRKFAKKSICARKKTICSKIEYFKHKKHHKKEKKPDTYKPEKKPDSYQPEKKPDTYK